MADFLMKKITHQNDNRHLNSCKKNTERPQESVQQLEIQMAAVIALRGMQRGDNFQLSYKGTQASNFYGIVYTTNSRQYFLHLEHINPSTYQLTKSALEPLLHRCFESYFNIIQDPIFKDIPPESSEFIIYTNQQLEPKCLQPNRQQRETDEIFKTCDEGEIFTFTPDENKDIELYTLVEKMVKESTEFGHLSPQEREFKLKMISEFLRKLIMVTGQKGQRELDDVITEEIRQHDAVKVGPEMYNMESNYFKTLLETCFRNKTESVTDETTRNCLQEAKTRTCASVLCDLFHSFSKELLVKGIAFTYSEISRLQTELSNNRAIHLRSDALTLCSILLLDCLPQSKCIFVNFEYLEGHTNEVLHAWLGGVWEWLIVFCGSTVPQSDICFKIAEIIKHGPSTKRVIILTACSVQQISNFVPIEHEFKFEQLSKKSQEIVLDKKIDFQGCEVTLRSVLQRHGNVQHVLGPELVTDLITEGTAVNIGGRLQENTGDYASMRLEREIYLQMDVLRNSDSYPDIFAVSGMDKKELVDTVPSYEIVGTFCLEKDSKTGNLIESYNKFKPSRFIILKSKNLRMCFSKLCEKHSGKRIHWLKYRNGCLLWKESRGSIGSLINYVDRERTRGGKKIIKELMKRGNCEVKEESIWDLGERTVLVVSDTGMGKSSTTTQVAWNTKLADPTSWVVRINWNDHTGKLQEIEADTFNFDSLVEFLCSAAFSDSKYTDINRNLLRQALQYSGNVTVLMDGFDEISPIHMHKAAVILSELMKTKVGRVWVTSRPVQRERLEEELSVAAFNLKNLALESLEETVRLPSSEEEKKLTLSLENESGYKGTLISYPLNITKPTTALEQKI